MKRYRYLHPTTAQHLCTKEPGLILLMEWANCDDGGNAVFCLHSVFYCEKSLKIKMAL